MLYRGIVGNGQFMGGEGDDVLPVGPGIIRVTGGAGRDCFVLKARPRSKSPGKVPVKHQEPPIITDFENGHDWIRLNRIKFKNLLITQGRGSQKRDTLIRNRLTSEVLVVLKGVNHRTIKQKDFVPTPIPTPVPIITGDPDLTSSSSPPTIETLSPQTLEEDEAKTITFTIADAEMTADALMVTVSFANPTLISPANLVLSGSGTTRTLTLTPTLNQSGSTTITLTVSDGETTTQQRFDLTVNPVNDAPINTVPTAQTVRENETLIFSQSNGNAIVLQDVDAVDQTIQIKLVATQGTVTLANTIGLSFIQGDGIADTSLIITGTLANVNTALNGLQFNPTPNFDGNASVQIITSDQGNTGSGGTYSDTDTVNISVVDNPAEIVGQIWNDANANGVQDAGEFGLANRTVFLDDNQNGFLDTGERSTTTDATGNYKFANLNAGIYSVGQVILTGWAQTSPTFAGGSANILLSIYRRDHVFDPVQNILYISRAYGTIERYRIDTEEWLPAIEVRNTAYEVYNSPADLATSIYGIDITPDGNTLYVAEGQRSATQGMIRKVDLRTGTVTNLTYALGRGEGGAWDITVAANGLALFTSRFEGSGWVPLRQIDLNTDAISVRSNAKGSGFGGEVRQDTLISSNGHRTAFFFTEANSSAGPIFTYDGNSNTFAAKNTTSTFLGNVLSSVNRNGTLVAMEKGTEIQIRNVTDLSLVRTLTGLDGGLIFDPKQDVLYAINSTTDQVIAYDTNTWAEVYRLNIGENLGASAAFENGVMSISQDSKFLAVSTSTGVRILGLPGYNASKTQAFNLSAGESQKLDFGTRQAGQLSQINGTIWNDPDRNGIQTAGEAGLAGWTVFLDQNRNGRLDSGETTKTTDANGNYAFTGLPADDYTIAEVVPAGWQQTSPGKSGNIPSTFIPVANRRDLIFDDRRNQLYITTSDGKVQRYDVATQTLLPAWTIGTSLNGGDITADNSTLYIAENQKGITQGYVYKVALDTGNVTTLLYNLNSNEAGVWDVTIGSQGKGLVSTRFSGSGSVSLRQLDLNTDTLSTRPDVPTYFHTVQQDTQISRSADRASFFLTGPNSSAGPITTYAAVSNTFPKIAEVNAFLGNALSAVSRDGSLIAMELNSGVAIMDRNFNAIENLTGIDGGIAFDPTDDILYAANSKTDQLIAYDTQTWKERYRWAIGEDISASSNFGGGMMTISGNGDYLFLSTESGIRMFTLSNELGLPKAHNINVGFGQTLSGINFGNSQAN
jgi:hypothetical protein